MSTLEYVRFTDADMALAQQFLLMPKNVTYGLRKFPDAQQYHSFAKEAISLKPQTANRIYALAQRDWHLRGQTGCMFARLAAKDADTLRWDYLVVPTCEASILACAEATEALQRAVLDPQCQVLSLLFPEVKTPLEAVRTIYTFVSYGTLWLEQNIVQDDCLHLHVRYPVATPCVQAWVMGFVPFEFVPNTRRSPYFEMAVRVKPKPASIFHRLNQDRAIAHLADAPILMDPKHQEDRWQSTLRRTRMILGREPDKISAAKSTLVVPLNLVRGLQCPHDVFKPAQRRS